MAVALKYVRENVIDSDPNRKKLFVIITDGAPTDFPCFERQRLDAVGDNFFITRSAEMFWVETRLKYFE